MKHSSTTAVVVSLLPVALYLVSPVESINSCYQCSPCEEIKDDQLNSCPRHYEACGKFASSDGKEIYRACVRPEFNQYNEKCNISLNVMVPGESDLTGCIYYCTANGCNSAPSILILNYWKILIANVLVVLGAFSLYT